MGEQYFRGGWAALGANVLNGAVSEWMIDVIKEDISRFSEAMIEHSPQLFLDKEEQMLQMKQCLELYIYGLRMRSDQKVG